MCPELLTAQHARTTTQPYTLSLISSQKVMYLLLAMCTALLKWRLPTSISVHQHVQYGLQNVSYALHAVKRKPLYMLSLICTCKASKSLDSRDTSARRGLPFQGTSRVRLPMATGVFSVALIE